MQRSTRRILTTHTGSLPRPGDLVAMLNAKELGEPYDARGFAARVSRAVSEVVQQQVDTKIDVVGDGEHSKFNWMAYARARLTGLEEIDSPVRFRGATRELDRICRRLRRPEDHARRALRRAGRQAHRAAKGAGVRGTDQIRRA